MAQKPNTEVRIAGNRVMEYFRDSGTMVQRMSALTAGGNANLVYGRANGLHFLCYPGATIADGPEQDHRDTEP